MLKITVTASLALLILVVSAAALPTKLTRSPTAPIRVETMNERYLSYGGKTVVLIGMSGEFLPQMSWVKPGAPAGLAADNCGAQVFQSANKKKYEVCIDVMSDPVLDLNLNVMRIWVGLNHTPGRVVGTFDEPFPYEQPYKWHSASKKWYMDVPDMEYEKSLYDVISYAQDHGVIVEVTLFDPFITSDQSKSPWFNANHKFGPFPGATPTPTPTPDPCPNAEFSSRDYFVKGDKDFIFPTNPFPSPTPPVLDSYRIDNDTNCKHIKMRKYQVMLAKRLVDLLNGITYAGDLKYGRRLYNFYWELANESDGSHTTWQQSLNWHYYMAWQLRAYEKRLFPGSYHLIAVNLAHQTLFDDLLPRQPVRSYIDIAEAHYVKKGTVSPEPTPAPAGATYYAGGTTPGGDDPGVEEPGIEEPAAATGGGEPGGEEPGIEGPVVAPGGGEPGGEEPNGEEPTTPTGGGEDPTGTMGGLVISAVTASSSELGALEMIRKYNVYGNIPNASKNTKVWGFNETRITGLTESNPVTAASVRAEAWEFMFSGGAIYDNMGFRWGNLPANNTTLNVDVTKWALADLGRLYSIVGESTLDLKNMKRTNLQGPDPNAWITNVPVYGSAGPPTSAGVANRYYALMRNNDTFLYYRHNSLYSDNNLAAKYDPKITAGQYSETVRFKNPFNCPATFTYKWIRPKTVHPEPPTGAPPGTIVKEIAESTVLVVTQPLAAGQTKDLPTGNYNYDIALKITKTSGCSTPLPTATMQTQSNWANAAVVTASSELNEDYPAASIVDGDRTGANWGHGGGWSDATGGEYPDWVQITYARSRKISEVDVYTLRDNYLEGSEVTEDDTFSQFGVTELELQYRDPETQEWLTVPNGVVAGNDKVLMRFVFEAIETDAIRVVVHRGAGAESGIDDHSRIVEVETYENVDAENGEMGIPSSTF